MKIELHEIAVKDVVNGYVNNDEEGVIGYGGKLNIRPKYQREFVYKDKQRDAVLDTVMKGFPLNVMYWVETPDGYEVMDGQQRTISLCEYITGKYSINFRYFFNLTDDEKNEILNYKLMIYFCQGTDKERLDWFRTINIAGVKLTDQELRNAVYTGPWLTDAKKRFSKTGCAAYAIGEDYVNGSPIRQDYLETAISWISGGNVEDYMSKHQNDKNANPLWLHFKQVIDWVQATFPSYRKEMKGIDWGTLYNAHKDETLDPGELEKKVAELMMNDDVTNKKGIYDYVLSGDERKLSIRAFTDSMKRGAYERQKGICPICGKHFEYDEMEGDHIIPWHRGGKTVVENCQMLCKDCNSKKSGK
jgi:hypothetical protein